jgi:hypothetical protein
MTSTLEKRALAHATRAMRDILAESFKAGWMEAQGTTTADDTQTAEDVLCILKGYVLDESDPERFDHDRDELARVLARVRGRAVGCGSPNARTARGTTAK